MPKEFLIGDTHFGDRNLVAAGVRPADNDDRIIENWRRVVGENDVIYHLGDIAYGTNAQVRQVIQSLPGVKVLVLGNHDRRKPSYYRGAGFAVVVTQLRLPIDQRTEGMYSEREIIVTHEPLRKVWGGRVNVHGHTHVTEMRSQEDNYPYINLSAEAVRFTPVNMKAVRRMAVSILAAKEMKRPCEAGRAEADPWAATAG